MLLNSDKIIISSFDQGTWVFIYCTEVRHYDLGGELSQIWRNLGDVSARVETAFGTTVSSLVPYVQKLNTELFHCEYMQTRSVRYCTWYMTLCFFIPAYSFVSITLFHTLSLSFKSSSTLYREMSTKENTNETAKINPPPEPEKLKEMCISFCSYFLFDNFKLIKNTVCYNWLPMFIFFAGIRLKCVTLLQLSLQDWHWLTDYS